MNTGILIIGFDYYGTEGESHLPGTLRDIKRAYNFCSTINPQQILIITDINPEDMEIKNVTSTDDIHFVQKTRNIWKKINSSIDFQKYISEFLPKVDRIIVYYSGHARHKGIILSLEPSYDKNIYTMTNFSTVNLSLDDVDSPSTKESEPINTFNISKKKQTNVLYTFKELKNTLVSMSRKKAQILLIMDCCSGDSLDMPFVLDTETGIYHLKSYDISIPTQEIVCISSSLKNQSSLSSNMGSLFTQQFFDKIGVMRKNHQKIKYIRLIRTIGREKLNNFFQTFNIHSSRPNLKYIFHWVLIQSKLKIHIENGVLCIEKN